MIVTAAAAAILLAAVSGCQSSPGAAPPAPQPSVPHQGEWGIYELDLATQEVRLVYDAPGETNASAVRLNGAGDRLVFAIKADGQVDEDLEIYSIGTDGGDPTRLTDNDFMDVYPAWSPDGERIAFLSRRETDLDIYVMNAGGGSASRLYDSGSNDADIDWGNRTIVFTSQFAIWKMDDGGGQPARITDPPDRGQWGNANLPAGDYDPRLSPDGRQVVFERLEDTAPPNGGYNLFLINNDGTGETRLTDNGYAQGLASWSHAGDRLVYVVAAINGAGKYDLYLMNSDGTGNHNITPDYFPPDFLCHAPSFSGDDTGVFFIGQWWEQK